MLLGSLEKTKRTLTTEETSIIIIPITITNTCRVVPSWVFCIAFYCVSVNRTSLERIAYHRATREIPHRADKLLKSPWGSAVC